MGSEITINFFWHGDGFDFIHYITILSHIKVGHNVVIWLYGDIPNSKYFHKLLDKITIKDSNEIYDINWFLKNPNSNIKTASSLWRFTFLFKNGGWYADCDAFAVKKWDLDDEYVVCSGEIDREILSIGVIKVPSQDEMFLDMIDNIEYKWGNVKVFDKYFKIHHPDINPVPHNYFYPFTWKEYSLAFTMNEIPDCYSIHLYGEMCSRHGTSPTGLLVDLVSDLM